jgi:hypothetical protein
MFVVLQSVSEQFQSLKLWLVDASALSKPLLHVLFGLLIYLIIKLFIGRRSRVDLALIAVLMVALLGELADVPYYLSEFGRIMWLNSLQDVLLTLSLPLLLSVGCVIRRWAAGQSRRRP